MQTMVRDFMLSLGGVAWTVAIGIWAAIITLAVWIRIREQRKKKQKMQDSQISLDQSEPPKLKRKKLYIRDVRKRQKQKNVVNPPLEAVPDQQDEPIKEDSSRFHKAFVNYNRCTGNQLHSAFSDKGMRGEMQVYAMAGNHFGYNRVVANVYLPSANGQDYETDLVILTRDTIYFLEVKNWKGKVVGSRYDKYWKHFFDGQKAERFNPFRQNYGHVCSFKELYRSLPDRCIFSVVLFNNLCDVTIDHYQQPRETILKRDDLIPFIEKRRAQSQPYFSEYDLDLMYKELLKYIKPDDDKLKRHSQFVQQRSARV